MKFQLLFLAFPLLVTGCSSCGKSNPPTPEPALSSTAQLTPMAGPDAQCKKLCGINGRCKAEGDKCVAVREADCTNCAGCRMFGACSLKNGSCVADKDEDCARSSGCKVSGKCTAKDGQCVKAE